MRTVCDYTICIEYILKTDVCFELFGNCKTQRDCSKPCYAVQFGAGGLLAV